MSKSQRPPLSSEVTNIIHVNLQQTKRIMPQMLPMGHMKRVMQSLILYTKQQTTFHSKDTKIKEPISACQWVGSGPVPDSYQTRVDGSNN